MDTIGHVRAVLLGDNEFQQAGLRAALEGLGIAVVGQAVDAEEALLLADRLAPDVLVVSTPLEHSSAVDATRRLATLAPETPVLVLADSRERSDLTATIRAGASGYMTKDAPNEAIAGAIRTVAAGDAVISSKVARHVLADIRNGSRYEDSGVNRAAMLADRLTGREKEVLRRLAAGKENVQIAAELHLSPSTVKNHISSILVKLGVENRVQAAVYAVRGGIA